MTRVLSIIGLVTFAGTLFLRAVDPVIPQIAVDMAVDPNTAVLLSTAFALPYALMQPVLGPLADMVGKTRMMTVSLLICALAALAGTAAPNFTLLVASRIVAGIAAGGVFPAAMAAVSDLVPVAQRQVALGRLIAAAISGQILGASCAGFVGDLIGWRGVFAFVGIIGAGAAIYAYLGLRDVGAGHAARFDLGSAVRGYREIFANPRAKVCYGAVFLEGIFIFGLFPYVALLLLAAGEGRAAVAGIVIAGFGVGGIAYSMAIATLLGRLGERRVMMTGGIAAALALAGVAAGAPWPLEFMAFAALGFGFYMLHGSIQLYATELAPTARGAAMAMHSSSFFLGQALGPVVYGLEMARFGSTASILIGAAMIVLIGWVCARLLPHPGDQRPR